MLVLASTMGRTTKLFGSRFWNRQLVLLRETADKADLAPLQKLAHGAGRCHFQMYLDQEHGRATLFGTDGHLLAEMTVPDAPAHSAAGLRLKNHHGGVRLEQLRITRWNGHPPREVQADKSRLSRLDGSMVYGEIKGFDASASAFSSFKMAATRASPPTPWRA